jgi:hypothetical protein
MSHIVSTLSRTFTPVEEETTDEPGRRRCTAAAKAIKDARRERIATVSYAIRRATAAKHGEGCGVERAEKKPR